MAAGGASGQSIDLATLLGFEEMPSFAQCFHPPRMGPGRTKTSQIGCDPEHCESTILMLKHPKTAGEFAKTVLVSNLNIFTRGVLLCF